MKQTAWIVFTALLLYVLSVGPAWRFQIDIVHRPLDRIGTYRLPGTLLASYINLWLPRNDCAIWTPRMGVIIIEGNSLDSQ
jgi:hypothetical protein